MDHTEDVKSLREGFNKLIQGVQEQKFSEFLKDLDEKIDKKMALQEKGDPDKKLLIVLARVDALEKKLSAQKPSNTESRVNQHLDSLFKRVHRIEQSQPMANSSAGQIGDIQRRIQQMEKKGFGNDSKEVSQLQRKIASLEVKVEQALREKERQVKEWETGKRELKASASSNEELNVKIIGLEKKLSAIDVKAWEKKIHALEREMKGNVQKDPQPAGDMGSLKKRLFDIERQLKLPSQEIKNVISRLERAQSEFGKTQTLAQQMGEKMLRMEKSIKPQKIDDSGNMRMELLSKESEIQRSVQQLEKKIGMLEKSFLEKKEDEQGLIRQVRQGETEREKTDQAMDSLSKKIIVLEKRENDVQNARKKIESLEESYALLSKQIKELLPTKKILEIDVKEPSERQFEPLIKGLEEKRKASENDIMERIASLNSSFSSSLSEIRKNIEETSSLVEKKMAHKESELMQMISQGDFAINKKMNTQFLTWLGGLEDMVKKKVHESLEDIESLRKHMDEMKRHFAKKQELQEFEESVLSPLDGLEKNMRKFIRSEIERVESELRKGQVVGKIDHRTLQKEIDRVVKEMERQRTQTLEQELGKIVKESEKLKKKK